MSLKSRIHDQANTAATKARSKLLGPARRIAESAEQIISKQLGRGSSATTDHTAPLVNLMISPDKNLRYDIQTAAIITKVMGPGDLAIDVGCHQGAILDHMLAVSPGTRHLAFEPLPHLAEALRTKYPQVELHEVALVEEPSGNIEFHHVVSNPGYSGIRERRYDREGENVELISVATARLDDIVPNDANPKIIKIDVEGAELGVLKGAQATIARSQPLVVFENGLGASDHYGTTPIDIFDFFKSNKMNLSLLGTWLEDGPPLSMEQYSDQYNQGLNYYFIAHP